MAVLASMVVAPLAASAAPPPSAPPAYGTLASAQPLYWPGTSSLPVVDLHVPFLDSNTNNLALSDTTASLALPDATVKPLSGDAIVGLSCTGFDPKQCKDPFQPEAKVGHLASPDGARSERAAGWTGKDGKAPGNIRALTDCPGNCGPQLVHSMADGAGPAGSIPGYVSIGGSSATQDISLDDKGRVVSTARSELHSIVVGPKSEVRIGSLTTFAQAVGAGAENSKDGRADLRATDFVILDNPVELTRAGIRLANGAPSEQEAYDGGKVLLQKLKDRGITLELPDFNAQVSRKPDHVTVDTDGLHFRFDQSVQNPAVPSSALSHALELGHSTAVVAAFDNQRNVQVKMSREGEVVVDSQPMPTSPAAPGQSGSAVKPVTTPVNPSNPRQGSTNTNPTPTGKSNPANPTQKPGAVATPGAPTPETGGSREPAVSPDPNAIVGPPAPPQDNRDLNALNANDLARKLGLRDAHSVSSAFGAFLGLGLILPLARFVIRRLG
jgi:hypothetical protein